MRRYILTGTPGAGKTSILHALKAQGFAVVAEAATDIIAEGQTLGVAAPWENASFVGAIASLQRERRQAAQGSNLQFHDRSALCTLALCRHLGRPVPSALEQELKTIASEMAFERRVFFIENLGYCEPSAVRRITFAQSLEFERVHEAVYLEAGYSLVRIAAAPILVRVAQIVAALD